MIKYEEIQDLLSDKLSVEKNEITLDSRLIDDLGADSLDLVEVVMEMEERYNIVVSDEEASKLYTVNDIMSYVKSYK